MSRSQIYLICLAISMAIVAVSVLVSVSLSGSWLPGLPLGVLAGLAASALMERWLRGRSARSNSHPEA
jgi:hypothetical protein